MGYKNKIIASGIDSENATDGHVLTADGSGGVAFEAAAGGGGSNKMTFVYNQAFFNSTIPAGDGYLPVSSSSFSNSAQRYNAIQAPYECRLKRVSIVHQAGNSISSGDYTVELFERDTSGSGLVSIESQTLSYTENISSGNYDFVLNFDFTTSAVIGPGSSVWLEYSTTNTTNAYGNTVYTIVFEEL